MKSKSWCSPGQLVDHSNGANFDAQRSAGADEVEIARKNMPSLNGDPEFEAIIAEYEEHFPLKQKQDQSD